MILRMPYHGLESHRVSELKRLSAQDLRAYADQAVDIAAGLGDEIVVVGISGGGAVSSWMAQNRLTTAQDTTANNGTTAKLVDRWREGGSEVVTFEFEPSLDIPHNSVDPAADAAKKQIVYEQLLKLLGEE